MSSLRGVVLLLALLPSAAAAQTAAAARSLRLAVDNDLIAVRGAGPPPDHDYTHGTRLTVAWAGAPGWVRRLVGGRSGCRDAAARRRGCVATAVAVGQEIYTPRRDAPRPVPGERPYAGWLYAAASVRAVAPGRVRSAGLALGVTGRPSLAEQVQGGLHRLLHNQPQLGWAHQLRAEPGLVARYDESRGFERALGSESKANLALYWGAAAGNVLTAFHVGAAGRIGLRGDLPWSPDEPEAERPLRFYGLAGYRQDFVVRNLFVDGSTFGERAGAERRAVVGQFELGVGLRRRGYAVEYRYISRGREYRAQPEAHAYGSLSVTARLL